MLAMSLCGSPAGPSNQRRRLKTSVLDQDRSDCGGCGSEADCEERWAAINKQTFQEILNAILSQTILISSPATKPHLQLINQLSVCSTPPPPQTKRTPPLPDSKTSRDITTNISFHSFNAEKEKPVVEERPSEKAATQSCQVPHKSPSHITESQIFIANPVKEEISVNCRNDEKDTPAENCTSTSKESQMKTPPDKNETKKLTKDHSILTILGRQKPIRNEKTVAEPKTSRVMENKKASKGDSRWLAVDKSVLNKLVESILSEPIKNDGDFDDVDSRSTFGYLPMYLPNLAHLYRPLAFNPWQLYPINLMSFSTTTMPNRSHPLPISKESSHRTSPKTTATDRASVVVENSSVLRSLLDADDEEILGKAHAEATPLSPHMYPKHTPKQRPEIRRRRRNKVPLRFSKTASSTAEAAAGPSSSRIGGSSLKWKSSMLKRVNSDGSE